jgi:HEAT repeat protein
MRRAPLLLVAALTLLCAVPPGPAAPPESSADEQVLNAAGLASDGASLLDFFRTRTRPDVARDKLMALTKQLRDPEIKVRARAATELVSHGAIAIPVLRHAVNDLEDPEVANRAQRCLQIIDGPGGAALPAAAARLVALRKPAGAAEVLLAYLPFGDDQSVIEEVGKALAVLAFPEGKPDPALLKALDDPVPLRRALAGAALCRKDQPEQWPVVRKLLRDAKPMVRLRVSLALANQQDVEAVPVLIDLLAELPQVHRAPIEAVLQQMAGEWSPNPALQGDDDVSRKTRRDAWAGWWRNTEGPALLAEFRKRTLTPAEQDKLLTLIQNLGDDTFVVREQATADLVAYGPLALPLLREAARGSDLERVRRAEDCLRLIAKQTGNVFPTAAARLVALRRPSGAVPVLLDYLPFADNDSMVSEVQLALTALAMKDGKPESVLVQALGDKLSLRRAAAAEALARAGGPEERAAVSKLLKDGDLGVRFRVALALATSREKDAVPVLIDLLAELPPEQTWQAVDFLHLVAGDKAPSVERGSDAEGHKKFRDAWAGWWKENGPGLDLARIDATPRLLGYTLVVQVNDNGIGRVIELGRDNKPRWIIENLQYPVDAHVLGENRVLVAEYNGSRVSERDFKGNIVWQKEGLGASVTNAQRLPNGNTFIATNNQVLEVDRAGKTVFSHAMPTGVTAAAKAPNGHILCLTSQGQVNCVRLDATGKELKSFPANRNSGWTSGIDLVPNGNILISQPNRNTVTEYDPEGKSVWEANAPGITTATRLVNGHTLVASHAGRSVVELDRTGKTVWEYKDEFHQFRARRR